MLFYRRNLIKRIFIFICFFTSLVSAETSLRFDHITPEQGLSQSTVFSIAQDEIGFMWFATADGLNKYDGYTFNVYRPDPLDSTSISELGIRKILKDREGNLWVVTLGGKVDRYLPELDCFAHYQLPTEPSQAQRALRVIAMTQDTEGKLWLGTTSGSLFYYDKQNDSFIRQSIEAQKPGKMHLQCLVADSGGVLWLGTWEGLLRYDPISATMKRFVHDEQTAGSLGGNLVFDLALDQRWNLWIATADGGVSLFARGSDSFEVFAHNSQNPSSLSSNRVMCVFADNLSRIWVGTVDAGLNLFDPDTRGFHHYQHHTGQSNSLGSGAVISIFQDSNDGLWFGTSSSGVNRIDPHRQSFQNISHQSGNPASLSHNTVLTVLEDRAGGLWVGTDGGGLNYRPAGSERFRHFFQNPGEFGSNSITALYQDSRGLIWIGTDPGEKKAVGAILTCDPKTLVFRPFTKAQPKLGGVVAFYQDHLGDLWIGTIADGLRCYHPQTGKVDVFKHQRMDSTSISSNSIFSIVEDMLGNMWFGTVNAGVNCWNRKTTKFKRYGVESAGPDRLSNNTVWCLYADEKGDVWMGTWGGGLNVFRRDREIFQHFTTKNGLPSNVVNNILPDSSGNLWLGTNHGICRFNPQTLTTRNYDYSVGLQGNEFNPGAACAGKDGTLYFGGTHGITMFHPGWIRDNHHIPPVVLTDFRIFDKPLSVGQSLGFVREITLSYRQNFFSFGFAALDYTAPQKNQYKYMLEGIDPDWVRAGNRRYASYTNISPGEYVFKVMGSNNDGVWNNQAASIKIRITPPFWQTWWFRLLMVTSFAAALFLLHRYRLNKLLAVERTRIRIARDLHDDISGTLTGIVYFSDALGKEVGNRKTPAIEKLLSLIHESSANVQDSMSDIIWSINPENDKWEHLLPKLRRFVSDICESKGIHYDIEIPELIESRNLDMERRRNFWLIFKEIVTNAVRHSECRKVTVSLSAEKNRLRLFVADDGKGFNPKIATDGNGLKNIYSRAKALNGKVQLTTGIGKGTRWEVSIPL